MAKGRRNNSSVSILRFLLPMSLAAIVVGSGYWGWRQLMKPDTLPFHHIQITSKETHLSAAGLEKVAWGNLQGGFFSLKGNRLKRALLDLPWVADVSFRRHWPDTLQIMVTEQQPLARWGKAGVINNHGDVFYPAPKTIPKDLSILKGPDRDEKEIVSNYQMISDAASAQNLFVKQFDVSSRLSYRVALSNGIIVVIGREAITQRFNRFMKLYPRLIGQKSAQVLRVDLRYANGIAIRWKSKK